MTDRVPIAITADTLHTTIFVLKNSGQRINQLTVGNALGYEFKTFWRILSKNKNLKDAYLSAKKAAREESRD